MTRDEKIGYIQWIIHSCRTVGQLGGCRGFWDKRSTFFAPEDYKARQEVAKCAIERLKWIHRNEYPTIRR